jgi:hypothetical protein
MVKDDFERKWQKDVDKILNILKDIDMKVTHVIDRLKMIYNYLNSLNASLNSK